MGLAPLRCSKMRMPQPYLPGPIYSEAGLQQRTHWFGRLLSTSLPVLIGVGPVMDVSTAVAKASLLNCLPPPFFSSSLLP